MSARNEVEDYSQRSRVQNWEALLEAERERVRAAFREARYQIETRWDTEYHSGLRDMQSAWRNQMRRQNRLMMALAAITPLGAVNFLSMDLARTGFVQQERIEDALNAYLLSLAELVHEKRRETFGTFRGVDLSDFIWFTYRDTETLGEYLARNAFHILNLALLAVLGFAGAYVAILRYDVR